MGAKLFFTNFLEIRLKKICRPHHKENHGVKTDSADQLLSGTGS